MPYSFAILSLALVLLVLVAGTDAYPAEHTIGKAYTECYGDGSCAHISDKMFSKSLVHQSGEQGDIGSLVNSNGVESIKQHNMYSSSANTSSVGNNYIVNDRYGSAENYGDATITINRMPHRVGNFGDEGKMSGRWGEIGGIDFGFDVDLDEAVDLSGDHSYDDDSHQTSQTESDFGDMISPPSKNLDGIIDGIVDKTHAGARSFGGFGWGFGGRGVLGFGARAASRSQIMSLNMRRFRMNEFS